MIRPILNARLDGAATVPSGASFTAASGSTVDLSLATVTLPASITSTFFDFKGNFSASGNPNYPVGVKGDVYYISVAGKVGGNAGKTVTVGDMLICSVDNAGGSELDAGGTIGTSWFVTQSNLDMTNVAITGGSITGITDLTVADGGTGRSTGTTAYALVATGTSATGAQQTLASGATTELLVGGGTSALPVWTTATGTGAPVRGTSPTFTTSVLIPDGTAAAPSVQFSADTNTGIYRIGADNFGFATAGVLRWNISASGNLFSGSGNYDYNIGASLFLGSSGSASTPTFTFGSSSDTNTGIYRVSEDQIGFTAGGTLRATINTTDLVLTVGLTLPKTITAPATTGAQTINKTCGSVNFAGGASSLVVTNSLVTTSSVILVTGATNDVDQSVFLAVAGAGSFTIYAATVGGSSGQVFTETRVNFLVLN